MNIKYIKFLVIGFLAAAAGIFYSASMPEEGVEMIAGVSQEEILTEILTETSTETGLDAEGTEEETIPSVYFIHVCGEVKAPGVYELPEGSRIYDAVNAAGGFTGDAAESFLNLAEPVTDGMKVAVPSKEDIEKESLWALGAGAFEREEGGAAGRVNINTASKEELMTLTGIGEARAEDIIRYREKNGKFEKVEDIMKISGIKEAAFEKIKEDITVQ